MGSLIYNLLQILNLLLKGALRIGEIVRAQIQDMLEELKNVHKFQNRKAIEEPNPSTSKGTVNNRFTRETVVITASSKVKTSCDLQLPSMVPLTSKSSSQIFFLRVLRVIVQIRDAIKKTLEKGNIPLKKIKYLSKIFLSIQKRDRCKHR